VPYEKPPSRRCMRRARFVLQCALPVLVCVAAAAPASAAPYIYDAWISELSGTDSDLNGYFETFEFGIVIDADAGALVTYNVAAVIRCLNTGDEFFTMSWSGFGNDNDPVTVYFSEADFFLPEPTNLYFEIELWDPDFTTFYDLFPYNPGPVAAESPGGPSAIIYSAEIVGFSGTDADANGYYETFSFDVSIDADTAAGASLDVVALITCTATGDSWLTAPWTIIGDQVDPRNIPFSQSDFDLAAPELLTFDVTLYNADRTRVFDEAEVVGSFRAEPGGPAVTLASASVQDLRNRTDEDADGFDEACQFDIAIQADTATGQRLITADISCLETGQQWRSSPWTAVPGSTDTMLMTFSEADFSLAGPAALTFTITLWDASHTLQLTQKEAVTGPPVKIEPSPWTGTLRVQGTVRYKDHTGTPRPVRYALVDIYEDELLKKQTVTDANGRFDRPMPVAAPADYRIRVYAASAPGGYPGATSEVAAVRDSYGSPPYYIDSPIIHNSGSVVRFDILIDNTGDNAGAFAVFDSVIEGYHKAVTWLGSYSLPAVNVYWPDDDTYYDPAAKAIHLLELDRWDRDVVMHEYGHFIAHQVGFLGSQGGDHDWDSDCRTYGAQRTDAEAARLAFDEAWATFFSVASQFIETADPCYNDTEDYTSSVNLETDTARHYAPGEYYESMIACALWDATDDNDDPVDDNDLLNLDIQPIWSVLSDDKPNTAAAFWDAWLGTHSYKVQMDRVFRDHRMMFLPIPCSITVTSDIPSAPFELAEKDSEPLTGTTPHTFQKISPGSYTLTWLDAPDGITPPPQAQEIRPGQSATFHGVYTPADPDPPEPNAFAAAVAIGTDRVLITSEAAADATPPVYYRIVAEAYDGAAWHEGLYGASSYDWSETRPNNWIDADLAENTLYRYTQYVRDSAVGRNVSEPVSITVTTLLGPPADDEISFELVSETSVRVTVAAPLQNSGPGQNAACYDIITGEGQGEGAVDSGWLPDFSLLYSNLLPNTEYGWRVRYRGYSGYVTAFNPNEQKVFTPAATPPAPGVAFVSANSAGLQVDAGANPGYTELAVRCISTEPVDERLDQVWLARNGEPSAEPVWSTAAQWGVTYMSGLQPLTTYRFAAAARNGDGIQTPFSPPVTMRTTAPGDANGDCKTNILDLIYIRMYLNRKADSAPSALAADLNNDGKVNILDMIKCRMYLGSRCPQQ